MKTNATTTLTVSTLRAATSVSVTLDMHPGADCAWVSHLYDNYNDKVQNGRKWLCLIITYIELRPFMEMTELAQVYTYS